jgi:hypothetical protein
MNVINIDIAQRNWFFFLIDLVLNFENKKNKFKIL